MSEPASALGAIVAAKWEAIVAVLGSFLVGMMAWLGKRQMARLDRIEGRYISREEHNQTVGALRNDFREYAERVERQVTEIHKRIDRVLERRD